MNPKFSLGRLGLFCTALGLAHSLPILAQTDLGGSLTSDLTLYASNGAHRVTNDLTVEAGVTLTIEAGVAVQFNAGRTLTVRGRLLANGTSNAPITFTRATAGTTWERIMFIQSEPSRLRHCIVEFADCEGDHKDYYDNDCNDATPPLPRTYFQAIVALASHLDIDGCLFRNLPSTATTAHGDAIAIISDDINVPGPASAIIRNSQFIRIGQGIHTRYAHVFVESCFFSENRNDNDDIDLYGESLPPSLVINNRFITSITDDMINPTRSSAVFIGNVIANAMDSGIVLRDRCAPVMINNIVYNCNSVGIDVQNTCDAVLVNNTIVDCGTGINFRDHTARWIEPYCLTPGTATATIINCILWDCNRSLNLVDSPSANQPGSEATVIRCNIEGGQAGAAVSGNSTLRWDGANLNSNPLFVNLPANDYRLTAASPCIDAGTNVNLVVAITNRTGLLTNLTVTVDFDYDGVGRPLDGNGDGTAVHDIGAYEFLLASADSNSDGIPDGWTAQFGLNPADPAVGSSNPDADPHTTAQEWEADTDPTDPVSFLRVEAISLGPPITIQYRSSSNRVYTLYYSPDLGEGTGSSVSWTEVPGQSDQPGSGGSDTLNDGEGAMGRFYRLGVALP